MLKPVLSVAAVLTLTVACAGAPQAQSVATPPGASAAAHPCRENAIYRAFDFWVGEWDVFTPDGQKAGENSITISQDGCLLFESWTPAGGNGANGGVSMNFYDPLAGKWRQVWSSPSVLIDYTGGLVDGAMRLEGEIFYHDGGQRAAFTGVWTPLPDGAVRQHFQQFDAATNAWSDWFIGIYRRKPGSAQP